MRGLKVFACLLVALAFGTGCSEAVTSTATDAAIDLSPTEDVHLPKKERPEDVSEDASLEDTSKDDLAEDATLVDVSKEVVEEDAGVTVDVALDQAEADQLGPNREPDVSVVEDVPAEIGIDIPEPMDVPADAIEEDAALDAMGVDHLDVRDADAPDAPLPIVLTVIFEGPPARSYPAGSTRVLLLQFRLIVGPYNLRLWWLPLTWEGLTENDYIQGSWGTNYILNRHLVDMVTGRDITPPYSSTSPGNARGFRNPDSLISNDNPMRLMAHHEYVVGAVVDIGTVEDAPGELFSGTHSYRATVGGYYPIDRDHFFAHSTIEDEDRFGVRYGPERIAGNVPMIGNPMTVLAR